MNDLAWLNNIFIFSFFKFSVSARPSINDLRKLSKIATTLGDKLDVVGILHGGGHSNVLAGNFVKDVKFVDQNKLATSKDDIFLVIQAYSKL